MIPENWAEKPPPPPQDEGKYFDIRSIHFRQFLAILVFVAEKPPPPDEGNFFDIRSIHFRQFRATLVFVAENPPPPRMRGKFLTLDLSISGNFEQLWFLWQNPPPQDEGKFFDIGSTTQGLPPVTKDYLPVTLTRLVLNLILLYFQDNMDLDTWGRYWTVHVLHGGSSRRIPQV